MSLEPLFATVAAAAAAGCCRPTPKQFFLSVLLLGVGAVVFLNNVDVEFTGKMSILSSSYAKGQVEIDDEEADRIIHVYLEHRAKGLTLEQITREVFKVELPNANLSHSYPFVTESTFRAYADVVIQDDGVTWTPPGRDFRNGDVLFMRNQDVKAFVDQKLLHMNTTFILITHWTDYSAPIKDQRHFELLESPLLIHWFARNAIKFKGHPKFSPLPIGLRPRKENYLDLLETYLQRIPPQYTPGSLGQPQGDPRPTLVFTSFYVHKPGRDVAKAMFSELALDFYTFPDNKDKNRTKIQDDYFRQLTKSKFVPSPAGGGIDCFRTFESILLGAIPIVKSSGLDPIYAEVPALVLDDWWQAPVNATALKSMLLSFQPVPGTGRRVLMAQYWFDKIEAIRKRALEDNASDY